MDLRNDSPLNPEFERKRMKRENIPDDLKGTYHIGPFIWDTPLPHKSSESRLKTLVPYFTKKRLSQTVVPIISVNARLSLRLLHYFIITYTKRYKVVINQSQGCILDIYNNYRAWLNQFKRYNFDTFRRGPRIYFKHQGFTYSTTVGQLNFLYWVESTGILKYVVDNLSAIETDMNQRLAECALEKKERKQKGLKRKRMKLSMAPAIKCFIYKNTLNVSYECKKLKTASPYIGPDRTQVYTE